MAHIDEGTLQAYLDDEVAARAEIDEHLAACTECAAELSRLRAAARLFATAMHGADVRPRTLAALAEVRARTPQPLRIPASAEPRRFAGMSLAKAAMLVVGLAAVASSAIPGSPVRALIAGALHIVGIDRDQPAVSAPRVSAPAEPAFEAAGASAALSIQPLDGRVRIVLTRVAPEATVRVRLVDGDRATVHATGSATAARFRTAAGRIEVVDVTGGEVLIDLPRNLMDARVIVDGKVIFENR